MAQNDDISADGAFEKTIELNPNNAGAYRNRGIIARRSNKPELAKNYFLEATRRDSQDIAAHYNLAVVHDEQGETGRAIEYFRKFRDLAKGLPDWRAELSHAVSRIEELEKKLPRP
jgi:tetratricopeptide (TPR) repeat protein